ncbi:MAG: 50S ribosomal protein L18 [Pyrinomonadaceae bacterium]|nr:50S ribosomal protein L18 [Pyrinomonadaceae bacterium]
MAQKSRAHIRKGVHSRIRKKVSGTPERPRLAVFRSTNHIYAQVIDDVSGSTLASASTTEKALKVKSGGNVEGAKQIGKTIAERAITAGVSNVVYDRGGYVYHGRVKALLDATREAGLNKSDGGSKKSKKKASKSDKKEEPKKKPAKKAKAETKKGDAPKDAEKKDKKAEPNKDAKPKTKPESKKVEKEESDNE